MKRREFLQTGLAALASTAVGHQAFAGANDQRLRVGVVGAGWYGKTDLYALCQVAPVDVVAMCDPDAKMLDEAAERAMGWQQSKIAPHEYSDYRQMFANYEMDVALVATPDHWHALETQKRLYSRRQMAMTDGRLSAEVGRIPRHATEPTWQGRSM